MLPLARFWGWSESQREYDRDYDELSQRVKEGKLLYGESYQSVCVQSTSFRNSQSSRFKSCTYPTVIS